MFAKIVKKLCGGKLAIKRTYKSREDKSLDLYLKEISEVALLTASEEVLLARQIKEGDIKSLHALVEANLRFVVNVSKKYQNQGLSLADLIHEGNLGLIEAAKRFDETKGYKFISYAVWWIRQSILQALAEQSRIVRLPLNRSGTLYKIGKTTDKLGQSYGRRPTAVEIADELDMTLEEVSDTMQISSRHVSLDAPIKEGEKTRFMDFIPDVHSYTPEDNIMESELRKAIVETLKSLSTREAEIIDMYFGLSGSDQLTLEEIGKRYNLTRERVRQIKEKALKRMRHTSRAKRLRTFWRMS